MATSDPNWRLPGGQPAATQAESAENPINPLRPKRSTAKPPHEPRAFAPPNDATQISAAVPAAVAQTAAVMPNKPVATLTRPGATRRPAANGRVARAPRHAGIRPSPHTPLWQRLTVALQSPEGSEDSNDIEVENLPLPGSIGGPTSDPFGPEMVGPYVDGQHMDGQYYPSCGPDGCGGECGCGDACSRGDACEPGCGCGPECGCTCCGDGCCGGRCCNDCLCIGPGDPESCHSLRIRVPKWQELMFFGGVQGFKGPYDQDRDSGNFGFHEGLNSGFKIPYTYAGYQIGYQAAQSQLNGDKDEDIKSSHTQHFVTFGLFRRVDDGLQFGTAWDVLRDQRFHAVDFQQLRSEVSWMDCGRHELGVSATVGLNKFKDKRRRFGDDEDYWQASDQYVLFYRVHGKRGGEGRIYGGWNDDSDGILGADMHLPVHDRWSVQTGFTYLIPDAKDGEDGASEEAWNINLSLVWHWGCTARKCHDNPYRPLFNVANNGTLIVDKREKKD